MELHWRETPLDANAHWILLFQFPSAIISQPKNKCYQQQEGAWFSNEISKIAHAENRHNISLRSAWMEALFVNKMKRKKTHKNRYCLNRHWSGRAGNQWHHSGTGLEEGRAGMQGGGGNLPLPPSQHISLSSHLLVSSLAALIAIWSSKINPTASGIS